VGSVTPRRTRSTPAQNLVNCQSSRDAHLLRQNYCALTALSLGMCRESVNPSLHASFAIIVTTLCYMQIFLIRRQLSLRHTHEMMKGTTQALPKMLRSPSAISQVAQVAPTAESLCNKSTTATQPKGLLKSALPTALVFVRNVTGSHTTCRVLLDSGSELSYISERCVKALGLARSRCRTMLDNQATSSPFRPYFDGL